MRSNRPCNWLISGPVYSTNSKPTVPIGLGQSSMAFLHHLLKIVSYATISSQDEYGRNSATGCKPGLDDPAGLAQLHRAATRALGSTVRAPEHIASRARHRSVRARLGCSAPFAFGNSRLRGIVGAPARIDRL